MIKTDLFWKCLKWDAIWIKYLKEDFLPPSTQCFALRRPPFR